MSTSPRAAPIPRNHFTLRFNARGLEPAFLQHHANVAGQHQRMASAAGVLLFLLGIVWIRWLVPDVADEGARILLGGPVAILMLTFVLSFFTLSDRARQTTAFLDMTVTTGSILLIVQELDRIESGPFGSQAQLTVQVAAVPALFLVILVTMTYVRMRFLWAIVGAPIVVAMYVFAAQTAGVESTAIAANAVAFTLAAGFGVSLSYLLESGERQWWFDQLRIEEQRRRADDLLHSILPEPIADRVQRGERRIADRHDAATVLFADLVGFTAMTSSRAPGEMLDILDALMRAFDAVADAHGLEKIKTVGDAYMAVAGVPDPMPDHADRAMAAARDMVRAAGRVSGDIGFPLQVRIGLDSGPLVAGIIGERKPMYDLWGDTVNTASRMESHGMPGVVHLTESVREALHDVPKLQPREIEVKSKGIMRTWIWYPSTSTGDDSVTAAAASSGRFNQEGTT